MKQVEADRQRMAPMITDLAVQITAFQPLDMVQVEVFVAEVERRLALLCDEGMVLKTFSFFPEKRLEAMREAVARKRELQKLTTTMDPHGHKWQARDSIALELHQVIDRFTEARPKVEWYMREAESIRKSLRAHAVPFDMDLVKGAQHAPLGLAKYGMRMLFTAHSRILQVGSLSCPSLSCVAPFRCACQALPTLPHCVHLWCVWYGLCGMVCVVWCVWYGVCGMLCPQAPAADAAAALPTVKELIGDVLKFAFQCHQVSAHPDSLVSLSLTPTGIGLKQECEDPTGGLSWVECQVSCVAYVKSHMSPLVCRKSRVSCVKCVMCQVSPLVCHVSSVTSRVSFVVCRVSSVVGRVSCVKSCVWCLVRRVSCVKCKV